MALMPAKGDSGFTLGGFLILAALGSFLWKGAPLESSRPGSDTARRFEQNPSQNVPARLWQDPFKAVYLHEQNARNATTPPPNFITRIEDVFAPIDDKTESTEVILLMVQLNPGAYAELEERRRRRRHAVLSGLGDEHFVPRNPEALSVFYQPNTASTDEECSPDPANSNHFKECYSVPYEWYDYEDPNTGSHKDPNTETTRHVLVMWLNESQFVKEPLTGVQKLVERLKTKGRSGNIRMSATLLGPERSDALRNLVNREEGVAKDWLHCSSKLSELNIISSTATVDDSDLVRDVGRGNTPLIKLQDEINNSACRTKADKTRMNFLRSIRSDKELVKELAIELKTRRKIDKEKDYVIVVSEWDTYFGRSLPRAFIKEFCSDDDAAKDPKDIYKGCGTGDINDRNVVGYNYQRGIDGIVAGLQNTTKKTGGEPTQKTKGRSSSVDAAKVRRPVGTGQFDYLRRLAADIRRKDREWRLSTGHGVRAVVLLGSDVYDKLLILRALRPELPGALFATTDLDAQLLHPAEYNWTRSLIIASTYDFGLASPFPLPLSITTMPFRDSYQTSIYLATRMSFNSDLWEKGKVTQVEMNKRIPPQLMEVGRQQLVRLPGTRDTTKPWNIKQPSSVFWPISLGLLIIAGLGIFAFHQTQPRAGRILAVLLALVLLFTCLGFAIHWNMPEGEPLNMFAGASIWPAEFIRVFSVILSLSFIWIVVQRLRENWDDLGRRYFWNGEAPDSEGLTVKQAIGGLFATLMHPWQSWEKLKPGHLLPLAMVGILILVMRFTLPKQLPLDQKIWLLLCVWLLLISVWWGIIYGRISDKAKVLSINKWPDLWHNNANGAGADQLWRSYGAYGASDQRFPRTIAYLLVYFAFASILFAILGLPSAPFRGDFAFTIDKIIVGFSVLSMLVLLFLVADASRLCICWVKLMRDHDVDWSKSKLPEYVQRLRLPENHAAAWIQIHLIGERTNEVTRLIYYPVTIILLMLLARSTYFDNWDFPQALAIIVGLNFFIVLGSIVRLNFVAQSVREDILHDLQDEKLAADRPEAESYTPSSTERQELINRLENLRIGAYMKVWEQPPVRATLMLLGGFALTYAEYLAVAM
jgi:hypothetical protein